LNDPPIPKPHSAEGKGHSVLLMIISLLLQTFKPSNPSPPPSPSRGEGKSKRDQSRRIFDLRVIKRSFIGISSWDFVPIFLKTTFPRFNSSSPRIRTYRALSLSALRI